MIARKEFWIYPTGLIVGSFGLEIASLWLNIPQKIISGFLWMGVGLLALEMFMRVMVRIKEFVKEMRA